MKWLFKLYHRVISPLFTGFSRTLSGNPYTGCRFEPTCSCYCEQAIQKHGIFQGSVKGFTRILKCHPFSKVGGHDPV